MDQFKREERYIVLKLKNMYELERKRLDHWLKVNDYEEFKTECVVVESDWPIYEPVWDMVQRLAEGREQELEQMQSDFNMAIDFVLDGRDMDGERLDNYDALLFLRMWREGQWPEIESEFPEFNFNGLKK